METNTNTDTWRPDQAQNFIEILKSHKETLLEIEQSIETEEASISNTPSETAKTLQSLLHSTLNMIEACGQNTSFSKLFQEHGNINKIEEKLNILEEMGQTVAIKDSNKVKLKVQYGGDKIHNEIDFERKFMAIGKTLHDYVVVEFGSSTVFVSSDEGVEKHKIDLKSKKI